MKVLLDTNVYFGILHDAVFRDRHRDRLRRLAPRTWLSSVVRLELLQGARGELGRAAVNRATRTLERVRRVVAPTHEDWVLAGKTQGRLWDESPALRTKRWQNDILIACSARRIGAIVVTFNLADFEAIAKVLPHVAMSLDDVA